MQHIEKKVEEAINSLDGAIRAEAKPFLLTRILARMQGQQDIQNGWARAGAFLSKPIVALAGLLLIILVNAVIIISSNTTNTNSSVQELSPSRDEFAINVVSIYDTENQEP
ncbi:hypothetical protein BH11BAC4_BH11BAC4_07980 [soil metagenome]